MADAFQEQQPSMDLNTRLGDVEEREMLLRDRVLLLGQSVIDERAKSFKEIQELKGELIKLKGDVTRMKELMQRMAEQISEMARKEELMILQRQFDLFRKA